MTTKDKPQDRLSRKGLTTELLKTLVRYEPDSGQFIRLSAPKRAAGKRLNKPAAPYINSNGYVLISLGRVMRFRAHHLAWLYMTGEWPMTDIDHVNGVRSDNAWANLRASNRSQNLANSKLSSANTSGEKGVVLDKSRRKWKAQIKVNYHNIVLGRFDRKEDAAKAYRSAALKYFGEFARVECR